MTPFRLIDGVEFDVTSGEVRRNGKVVRLEPQPAALLAVLARRAGEVVSHDEIRRSVWGDETHVNFPDGLHYCVRQVRSALADSPKSPRFVETLPRRGYRFRSDAVLPVVASPATTPPSRAWRRRFTLAVVATALAMTAAITERRPNDHHQIAVAVLKTLHDLVF